MFSSIANFTAIDKRKKEQHVIQTGILLLSGDNRDVHILSAKSRDTQIKL